MNPMDYLRAPSKIKDLERFNEQLRENSRRYLEQRDQVQREAEALEGTVETLNAQIEGLKKERAKSEEALREIREKLHVICGGPPPFPSRPDMRFCATTKGGFYY